MTRRIERRTRGHGHGPIVRLMSPSDFGEVLKPFVFLDLFALPMRGRDGGGGMPLHPHSGIATVTVFTAGDATFDDPIAGRGTLGYGGVEWTRAGRGIWHGRELAGGSSAVTQGFQLWIALPPELEIGPSESQYLEAPQIPTVGPARLIVGAYAGVASAVRAPSGLNYLLVTLAAGERWTYTPPEGHAVLFVAVATGGLDAGGTIGAGELVQFERGEAPVTLTSPGGATFVIGSGVPHPYPLHLGRYSVHSAGSPATLRDSTRSSPRCCCPRGSSAPLPPTRRLWRR